MSSERRFCEQCGSQLTSTASRYCPSCGSEVGLPGNRQTEESEENPQPRRRPPARSRQYQALEPPQSSNQLLDRLQAWIGSLPKTWKVIGGVGALTVIVILISLVSTITSSGVPEGPAEEIDLRRMLNLYEMNEADAEQRYKGSLVRMEGLVKDISGNKIEIIPFASDMFQQSGARCYVTSSDKPKISGLIQRDLSKGRMGSSITIRGVHKGFSGFMYTIAKIEKCQINPGPESAPSRDSGSPVTTGKSNATPIPVYIEKPGPTATPVNTPRPTSTAIPTSTPAPWSDCGPGIAEAEKLGRYEKPSKIFSPYPDMTGPGKEHAVNAQEYWDKQDYPAALREVDRSIEVDPDNWERVFMKISMYSVIAGPSNKSVSPDRLEEYGKENPREFLEVGIGILDALISGAPQFCSENSLLPYHYREAHLWRASIRVKIAELEPNVFFADPDLCQALAPIFADYKIAGNQGLDIVRRLESVFGEQVIRNCPD